MAEKMLTTSNSVSAKTGKAMELLLKQNALLEAEVTRLCREVDEVTQGILKRGYLHKYREREISFAKKWGLRYFVLQGKMLSYYLDDKDLRPRKTFDLTRCTVREEGSKKGGQYHVFSIFLTQAETPTESTGSLLLRLSSENGADASTWLESLERATVLEELVKSQSSENNLLDKSCSSDSISKLENSSTRGKSTAAAADDGGEFWSDTPVDLELISDPSVPLRKEDPNYELVKRLRRANKIIKKSASRQAVFSMHAVSTSTASPAVAPLSSINKKRDFIARSFPASKAMHLKNWSSPLSSDPSNREQSYRGFFNLGVIILFLSNTRMIVDNLKRYGVLIKLPFMTSASSDPSEPSLVDTTNMVQGILSWALSIFLCFAVEKVAARGVLSDKVVLLLHYLLGTCNIVLPTMWVWYSKSHPSSSMIFLLQSVIIWMKLISYAHVNRDLRRTMRYQKEELRSNAPAPSSPRADESPLARAGSANFSVSSANLADASVTVDSNGKPMISNIFAEIMDLEPPYLSYPMNLTVKNILYFCVVPTLCYQVNYPRSPTIRWRYILSLLVRMTAVGSIVIFAVEQYIRPTLEASISAIETLNGFELFRRLLRLSIPNTYVWLLGFYWFFHLWFNLLAELTRFGDRLFYKDWWNSRTIEQYWRNWNIPVHSWMLRHFYHPLVRVKIPKNAATFACFLLSALLHELIISTPFHVYTLHAFLGMMAQVPLIFVTKLVDRTFDNAFVGNAIFWAVFCVVGQPMGALMYYYDIWKITKAAGVGEYG